MTSMARAAAVQELLKFLSEGQASKVYAIFDAPPVVFACRVNQAFATHDKVYEFTYDGVTAGAYTDVLPGMTVLLGSAAGLSDKGITFARKVPTSSKFYNGRTSEVDWENDLFVTVLQDMGLWEEHLLMLSDGTALMKHDVAYTDQHANLDPVPILGCDRVVKLEGASVTVDFDGSNSYAPGSSVASHAFTCPGATITGANTATPSMEISATGRYFVTYTVTAANGKSKVTYRTIRVWDPDDPPANVTVESVSGDYTRGGYEFALTVDESSVAIRERTKVILFSEDWYAGALGSIGPIEGAENIIAVGWLGDEALDADEDGGSAHFTVRGPEFWFKKMHNFIPLGLESVSGTPTAWTQMQNLTVDLALWHFLLWRTTAANCMDIFLTGDTRQASRLTATAGSIWQQLIITAQNTILAQPCCDAYGRLFIEVDTALLPAADRGSVPTVVSLSHDDWETIDIVHVTTPPASQVILSGIYFNNGSGIAYFSLAPGHIPMRTGDPIQVDQLRLSSQAQANELAGSILEKENCPYRFTISNLLANNRLIGICPRQRISITISAEDTPRGIAYFGYALIRSISLKHDAATGAWSISLAADAETSANLFTNGDIPVINSDDPSIEYPPIVFPPFPPPPGLPPLPPPPAPPTPASFPLMNTIAVVIGGYGMYWMNFETTPYKWYSANTPFTAAQYQAFNKMVLGPTGYAFVASGREVYMTLLGSNRMSIVGSEAYLASIISGPWPWYIDGIGINPTQEKDCVIFVMDYSYGLRNYQFRMGATTMAYVQYHGGLWGNLGISNYGGNWFVTWMQGDFQTGRLSRWPAAFVTVAYTSGDLGIVGSSAPHIHAKAADIIYFTRASTIQVFDTLGTNLLATRTITLGETFQTLDCDPTGQHVMVIGYYGAVQISHDFGATWVNVTVPGAGVANGKLINMGSALDWLIAYNDVAAAPGVTLNIWRTIDGGLNWIDCMGDLLSIGVPLNGTVTVVRHA